MPFGGLVHISFKVPVSMNIDVVETVTALLR